MSEPFTPDSISFRVNEDGTIFAVNNYPAEKYRFEIWDLRARKTILFSKWSKENTYTFPKTTEDSSYQLKAAVLDADGAVTMKIFHRFHVLDGECRINREKIVTASKPLQISDRTDKSKRRVLITVDVEAQPVRARECHVDRLIFGRFADGADFGIGRMFDIAERHGVQLTCFLDYAETFLWGDGFLDVGRYIRSRNHDLQVHLHPDFIPKSVFEKSGIKYVVDMFKADQSLARLLIDLAVDAHMRVSGNSPVAFRGGGYRYNDEVLGELARKGFRFDSSYNSSRKNQPFNIGAQRQFLWTSGVVELPVSCVWNFKNTNRLFDYNFNADVLIKGSVDECVEKHDQFLRQFFDLHGDDAIAVL
ncbi:MAG: hypothetical protein LBR95_01610, partial [Azoarcus sp.]|nr:hypothetical protein [Azoarcus sp.]